jgi:SHAQKYF class myb-like DNA-binding protein
MMYFSPVNQPQPSMTKCRKKERPAVTGAWTSVEHERFLIALDKYPKGPWKAIADFVGTRTPRQVQTHAQKYREKLFRKIKRLSPNGKEVELNGDAIMELMHKELDKIKLEWPTVENKDVVKSTCANDLPSIEESLDFFLEKNNVDETSSAVGNTVHI